MDFDLSDSWNDSSCIAYTHVDINTPEERDDASCVDSGIEQRSQKPTYQLALPVEMIDVVLLTNLEVATELYIEV